ncbi:hypothetical protein [Marinobacter sp. X15-166B]|uniref:hypothetical protein n=1 Tax=Marinobacter sp. X15-166B TaxID=1897620 RepID=UPI0026CB545D|nr:hypothetical protein [Marinobacter sp. X15-166B]
MSACSRVFLLLFPLLCFALWGTYYRPAPSETKIDAPVLASLPPLPSWAGAPLPDFSVIADTT